MTPGQRLQVYRDQYWLRHLKNLEEDYPTLRRVLGSSVFRECAREYLREFPPRTWDLQRLGDYLPSYIARDSRWRAVRGSADAAALDWAFVEAFDAADAPPFDPRVLQAVPEQAWPSARVVFHPSLRPVALGFAVHELREAARTEGTLDLPPSDPIRAAPTNVVVARDARCFLRATVIEPAAFHLIEMLRQGGSLGEACTRVATDDGDDLAQLGERLSRWFEQWTAIGWVSAVRFPHSD
jgi:hypothetical protein